MEGIGLTTYEAGVFQYFFFLSLFTSQISKSIDDDTKNQVQNDNDNNEEEEQIVDNSGQEERFLQ